MEAQWTSKIHSLNSIRISCKMEAAFRKKTRPLPLFLKNRSCLSINLRVSGRPLPILLSIGASTYNQRTEKESGIKSIRSKVFHFTPGLTRRQQPSSAKLCKKFTVNNTNKHQIFRVLNLAPK